MDEQRSPTARRVVDDESNHIALLDVEFHPQGRISCYTSSGMPIALERRYLSCRQGLSQALLPRMVCSTIEYTRQTYRTRAPASSTLIS